MNYHLRPKLNHFFLLIVYLYLVSIVGCATLPSREALTTCDIKGTAYLNLVNLCEQKGINWDYDTFTRAIILTKTGHQINLLVGDTLILIDGAPFHLKHAVDLYQGALVVPSSLKETLDSLWGELSHPKKTASAALKIKKIIIDAGHGGSDPGATGVTGLREKIITLDLVKRLSKILQSQGIEVVLTRSSDRYVSLPARVEITNRSGADIFLSIHANANRVRSLSGFEAYYISDRANDTGHSLFSAQSESLNLASSCFASSSLNLRATLWDMIYAYNRGESIGLGKSICNKINRDLSIQILGVKGAGFYVLKGAHMPALLVEVGFLSNRNEERMLKNSCYRQQIAQSIAAGITNYAQELVLTEASY